uniref:C-C motif chemokine n=1 Tax=Taeniopygia guttata TaxID=59729 RepID=A0A674HRK9_TAEGU
MLCSSALSWGKVLKRSCLQSQPDHASLFPAAPYSPAECCFDYVKGVLRLEILVGFYSTSKECFLPAIVFDTKKKAKICANPEEKWVKRAVRVLLKKKGLHAP